MNEYPTDEQLEKIAKWNFVEVNSCFDFIENLWWTPDLIQRDGSTVFMSTGGWSGNEDIISAMKRNALLWNVCWVQSRKGGHYIFKMRQLDGQ